MKTSKITLDAESCWMSFYVLLSAALLLDAFVFDFAITSWLGLV